MYERLQIFKIELRELQISKSLRFRCSVPIAIVDVILNLDRKDFLIRKHNEAL